MLRRTREERGTLQVKKPGKMRWEYTRRREEAVRLERGQGVSVPARRQAGHVSNAPEDERPGRALSRRQGQPDAGLQRQLRSEAARMPGPCGSSPRRRRAATTGSRSPPRIDLRSCGRSPSERSRAAARRSPSPTSRRTRVLPTRRSSSRFPREWRSPVADRQALSAGSGLALGVAWRRCSASSCATTTQRSGRRTR